MPVHGDLAKVNDPNAIIEIAAGPPAPTLVPQKRDEGLRFGGRYADIIVRFIFKKAHMSNDDFRLFNAQGRLICNAWHQGKNPYGGMDPLNLGNAGPKEEWESLCRAAGHFGMPSFKVKPKMASRHGRQYVQAAGADGHWHTIFSVAKESRLKSMSLRHNFEICAGEGDERTLQVLCDMAGRTMQFMNNEGEQVAFVQKSAKALIQTVALGSGSEMIIDVAPGVDWTVIVAAMIGIQQVGAHFLKDAFGNYVAPAMQDAALGAVGLDGVAGQVGQETDQAVHMMRWGQSIVQQFYNA